MDSFLYDKDFRHERVNGTEYQLIIILVNKKFWFNLFYNTSARHECDTADTNATRVWHEQHESNTSETGAKSAPKNFAMQKLNQNIIH